MNNNSIEAITKEYIADCKTRGLSHNTIAIYSRAMDFFCSHNKGKTITEKTINETIEALEKQGKGNATLKSRMDVYKSFSKWGKKKGYFSIDRDLLHQLKSNEPEIVVLSDADVRNMINSFDTDTLDGLRNRAIVSFLACSGMRISELIAINRDEVPQKPIEKGKVARIAIKGKGKNKKSNDVFLNKETQEYIFEYLSKRNDDNKALFVSTRGKYGKWNRVDRVNMFRMIRRTGERVGIKRPIGAHTLRHYTACKYLRQNKNIKAVSSVLRHSNTTITEKYLHYVDNEVDKIAGDVMG